MSRLTTLVLCACVMASGGRGVLAAQAGGAEAVARARADRDLRQVLAQAIEWLVEKVQPWTLILGIFLRPGWKGLEGGGLRATCYSEMGQESHRLKIAELEFLVFSSKFVSPITALRGVLIS